jgi:hypothetical protein
VSSPDTSAASSSRDAGASPFLSRHGARQRAWRAAPAAGAPCTILNNANPFRVSRSIALLVVSPGAAPLAFVHGRERRRALVPTVVGSCALVCRPDRKPYRSTLGRWSISRRERRNERYGKERPRCRRAARSHSPRS